MNGVSELQLANMIVELLTMIVISGTILGIALRAFRGFIEWK